MTKIPKIIHQLWIGDKPIPDYIKKFTDEMPVINQGYGHRLWGNEVFDHYSDDEFLKSYMKSPDIYRWAFICDRIRCLLLDEFGGIYCDSDCKPIQSFDLILNKLNEDITFFTGLKPTQNNNREQLIVRQSMVKASCDFHAHRPTSDIQTVLADAQLLINFINK